MVSGTALRYIISTFAIFYVGLYPAAGVFAAEPGRSEGWHMGLGSGMMGGWGMGGFGGFFMMVFWILIIIGLIFMVKWLVQTKENGREGVKAGSRAIEILKKRYASGEIDKSQFETMKRDLADKSY